MKNSIGFYRRLGYEGPPQSKETRYVFLPDHDRDYLLMKAVATHTPVERGPEKSNTAGQEESGSSNSSQWSPRSVDSRAAADEQPQREGPESTSSRMTRLCMTNTTPFHTHPLHHHHHAHLHHHHLHHPHLHQ
ncbi:hypothetical protein CRUP_004365 [Coryphaenoides rupestris]|nr:hypothetical protein CRUP_004365 [Coryphaenoides rupestris]